MFHLSVSKWPRPEFAARCVVKQLPLPDTASGGFSSDRGKALCEANHMMQRFDEVRRLFLLLLVLLVASAVPAQVSTGTILGTVTDPTGALVNGATVTVINTRTNEARVAQSNSSGLFSVPNLITGHYDVAVKAAGFSSEKIADVTLDVGAQREVNFSLKVGNNSEQVVVTSQAATVDLASSTTMPVVDDHTIVQLPLNGRDFAALANLQPGVAAVREQSVVSISNQRANRGVGNQLTVSGARPQMNNYRLDGISINDYSNGGPGGVNGGNLGVDAIQEFSVVTGNATADYGKTAGGIVNAVTRTGGNKIHGDAYEFVRNSALDARNPFDPAQIPPFQRNQFGASIGGPIVKDRTFIFGNYEGLRQYQSTSASSTVPSANARNGQLVAGNVTVDPKVAPFLQFFPLPNSTVTGDTGLFLFSDPTTTIENYFAIHADHKINAKDQLAGTYFYDNGSLVAPDAFNIKVAGNLLHRQMGSVAETHIFTSNLLNTVHVGYSRVFSDAPTTLNAILPAAADPTYGFVPNLPVGLITVGSGVSPFVGGLHAVGEFVFHYNSYQAYDDLYWTHGKHSIKTGFAFERLQNNQQGTSNPNGQYIFGSLSAFLQNQPTTFNAPIGQTTSPKDLRQSVVAGYITDDYHLFRNLTVNLGMRYEVATVPTETAGRLANLPTLTAATPNLGSPYFSNPTKKNIAPRVGFAYSPFADNKTVVHGAYGIYDALPLDYLFEGLTIFSAPFFQSGSITGGLNGTFPNQSYPLLTPLTFRYSYTPQHPPRSYVQQYGLNVQHQFAGDLVATVGYSGSHGTHLPYREDDINTVQPITEMPGGFYEFPALYSTTTFAKITNPRINTNVGQISAMIPEGFLIYNSLQAGVTKRLTKHYQYQVSYTWAKAMDDGSSSTFGDSFANSVSSLPYFARDRRIAVSDYNIKNNLVLNLLVLLPDAPESLDKARWVLNGWQYGAIFQASTGLPITPLISGDPLGLNSSDTFDFPNRNYGCKPVNKINPASAPARPYLNAACFSYPGYTAGYNPILGNSARNSVIGPGLQDFDMSLVKNTRIPRLGDTFNVQFRAELFNVLNHSNYANPIKAANSIFTPQAAPTAGTPNPAPPAINPATTGVLSYTVTTSRQTQFAVKIVF
jgi:hypothetical protein